METKLLRPRRVRHTAEQIRLLLEEYERVGKSAGEFATEKGIVVSTLWAWLRRYRERGKRAGRARWVELHRENHSSALAGVAQVRLPDGLVLDIHRGFEAEAVARLVQLLRQG